MFKSLKYLVISLITLLFFTSTAKSEEINIKGVYQGLNLFIENPLIIDEENNKESFCIQEIVVNDVSYEYDYNSSAVCIYFNEFEIVLGDNLNITIIHTDDCFPQIINPDVLNSLSTYQLSEYRMIDNNTIELITNYESSVLKFKVEQYRWGDWVTLNTFEGNGGPQINKYEIDIYPHDGENLYRISQMDHLFRVKYSQDIVVSSDNPEVKILSKKSNLKDNLEFSDNTYFIIQDIYGFVIKKGYKKVVDVSDLKSGKYYLRYDKVWTDFVKK